MSDLTQEQVKVHALKTYGSTANNTLGLAHRDLRIQQLEQEVKELKALNQRFIDGVHHFNLSRGNINPLLAFVDESPSDALAQHDKEQVTFGVTDFVGTILEHGELCGHDSDFLVECKKEYIKQLQEQE